MTAIIPTDQRITNCNYISSIAFSPNGKHVALGYGGGAVNIVVKETLVTWQLLEKHINGWVSSISFSPDGTELAIGYERMYLGKEYTKRLLLESPDDPNALGCSIFRLRELVPGYYEYYHVKTYLGEEGVSNVLYNPKNSKLTVCSEYGDIHIFDTKQGIMTNSISGEEAIRHISYTEDGEYLFACTDVGNGALYMYQPSAESKDIHFCSSLKGHSRWVSECSVFGSQILSCATDGTVIVWDCRSRGVYSRVEKLDVKDVINVPCHIKHLPDGSKFVVTGKIRSKKFGGEQGVIALFDSHSRKLLGSIKTRDNITCLDMSSSPQDITNLWTASMTYVGIRPNDAPSDGTLDTWTFNSGLV